MGSASLRSWSRTGRDKTGERGGNGETWRNDGNDGQLRGVEKETGSTGEWPTEDDVCDGAAWAGMERGSGLVFLELEGGRVPRGGGRGGGRSRPTFLSSGGDLRRPGL